MAAATTEPLADALQMVRKAGIATGENVVVVGVGIYGPRVIQCLRALVTGGTRHIGTAIAAGFVSGHTLVVDGGYSIMK